MEISFAWFDPLFFKWKVEIKKKWMRKVNFLKKYNILKWDNNKL